MNKDISFDAVARLAAVDDNVAIAVKSMAAATTITFNGGPLTLSHGLLEGHRFCMRRIPKGGALLSWGLPFGAALVDIEPGDYVCNEQMIATLVERKISHQLPGAPNFEDCHVPYRLDPAVFEPGVQIARHDHQRYFFGIDRPGDRGVGTRNYIVILGTTSRVSGFVHAVAVSFQDIQRKHPNIDGVVAVAHTEGGMHDAPHNTEFLLRTLAGFIIHPNVGAVLIVDVGSEPVTNDAVRRYMLDRGYPLAQVTHRFLSIGESIEAGMSAARQAVAAWLDPVNTAARTQQSIAHLKLALQCGGSDAFSGVSANPLVGLVSKEIVRYGGCACLAETTELIGAEPYVLENARDLQTARNFLDAIDRFRGLAGWHGHTPEGNPSGGNRLRGLYNIIVKSIGAALKKDPDVRLDFAIPYGERMQEPGYYFMDTPGNDLESIAGEVAGGSNVIFFTTGNGSITNFPFVPTIKIVTTTGRYELLRNEMDVNAGAYLDGEDLEKLARETIDFMVEVANGRRTAGEKAGHSQVQIWRNWLQTAPGDLDAMRTAEIRNGKPLHVVSGGLVIPVGVAETRSPAVGDTNDRERIGLILPTSLCSGQIANLIARHLNVKGIGRDRGISRFVALPHTEGCGSSSLGASDVATRTLVGYLVHPKVAIGLLLEHGCEKFHNHYFQDFLNGQGYSPDRYGWASVQLDGGIESVTAKVEDWATTALASHGGDVPGDFGEDGPAGDGRPSLSLGLHAVGDVSENVAAAYAVVALSIIHCGGSVTIPSSASFLESGRFQKELLGPGRFGVTLGYAERPGANGLYVMDVPTRDDNETLTGLGATGAEVICTYVDEHPLQSNPMIPVVQMTAAGDTDRSATGGIDLVIDPLADGVRETAAKIVGRITETLCGQYIPKLHGNGITVFQITRGRLNVSL